MSRIGKLPISVPAGVDVSIEGQTVTVNGPKGTLSHLVREPIAVSKTDDGTLQVRRPDDERVNRSLHGLSRTLIANMVTGVTDGYEKKLEIVGVGYRVISRGPTALEFSLGYSHQITYNAPEGVTFRASTSSSSARWPRTSVSSANPNRTRAKGFGTPASRSGARSGRLVSDGYRPQGRQAHIGQGSLAATPPGACPEEDPRVVAAASPGSDPVEPACVRAGGRRPARQDTRLGQHDGARTALAGGGQASQGTQGG
jgi:large subunit ribosomal protein L6